MELRLLSIFEHTIRESRHRLNSRESNSQVLLLLCTSLLSRSCRLSIDSEHQAQRPNVEPTVQLLDEVSHVTATTTHTRY